MSVVRPFGESAFLVDVSDSATAQALAAALRADPPAGVSAIVPGRSSVLVEFDALAVDASVVAEALERTPPSGPIPRPRLRTVPVVYGGEYGPDLASVADLAGLDERAVVELHATSELHVLFCGFAPGFAYLGDVAAPLAVPRLSTPRTRTPGGSVAVADGMSGIYPADLPGGWRVIGRTPIALFDARRTPPAYLVPGDRVRFEPIPSGEWDARAGVADDW